MVDGAIRHGTDMDVEANKVKLYRPAAGEPEAWPELAPALTQPIRWERIAEQCDQMLKYATAIRVGTASTEAILRQFMKANAAHPHLPGDDRARKGPEEHLPGPLPTRPRPATGDP